MASVVTCYVHPVVLMSIVDAYERRALNKNKTIGTLMGVFEEGAVRLTDAYPVPFNEKLDTQTDCIDTHIDLNHNVEMARMLQKAIPSEGPVGWFSTDSEIKNHYLVLHKYYTGFVGAHQTLARPDIKLPVVLLTVDATMKDSRLGMKAYVSTTAGIPGGKDPHCLIFNPIKIQLMVGEDSAEQIALETILRGTTEKKREIHPITDLDILKQNTQEMNDMLLKIREYVNAVLEGKIDGDTDIGRKLLNILGTDTQSDAKHFENVLKATKRDYLMIEYLAYQAKTQLNLFETTVSLT